MTARMSGAVVAALMHHMGLGPDGVCRGMSYSIYLADALAWMAAREPDSIHAVITDPPYGLREYSDLEVAKLRAGKGGRWRQPPRLGGHQRAPVPRFTVLSKAERAELVEFFGAFARAALRLLAPGGHLFIASNPLLSHLVFLPAVEAGFEKRGEIVRLVQTLRGGDRPKGAHAELADITVMPRSQWEPWGLFRKPFKGRVQDNLRTYGTGALRRLSEARPFGDVIPSSPTRASERALCPHPSLKPQAFMRQIVRAALPLGRGVILDPFMGGGATIAAAAALGLDAVGVERDPVFYQLAEVGIPRLAALKVPS